ncbi:hypothetical protein E2C01_067324 [Portunus trituberculatus]|uniref:Uncharacterized protein n=1 Tax=Portunus trituberculatus TaxID=210409 RepID=A0A5B7HWD7_PORTR|nr:hypothetical protein [Portunus trituberculatus]
MQCPYSNLPVFLPPRPRRVRDGPANRDRRHRAQTPAEKKYTYRENKINGSLVQAGEGGGPEGEDLKVEAGRIDRPFLSLNDAQFAAGQWVPAELIASSSSDSFVKIIRLA